jgi:amidase
MLSSASWEIQGAKARNIRDQSLHSEATFDEAVIQALPINVMDIPRTCGKLTQWEIEVTENYDASALIGLMVQQQVTAVDVLQAFRKRATIAQQLV